MILEGGERGGGNRRREEGSGSEGVLGLSSFFRSVTRLSVRVMWCVLCAKQLRRRLPSQAGSSTKVEPPPPPNFITSSTSSACACASLSPSLPASAHYASVSASPNPPLCTTINSILPLSVPPLLSSVFCMSPPQSLLHLTLATAVLHIHRLSDLSSVPDHLVLHLFQQTLAAGKLTDPVLRMFLATDNEEVLQFVKALQIRPIIKPILPTLCSDKKF